MTSEKRAVLFDLDGVIALTEPLKAKAHLATVHQLGGCAQMDDYLPVMGNSHEVVRAAMIQAGGTPIELQAYSSLFRRLYQELMEKELEIRPGIPCLVLLLKRKGYLVGVVSSSIRPVVEWVIAKASLASSLDLLLSADDVQQKKPHPEPYQKAMSLLMVSLAHTLVFEDSQSGIFSAVQAGAKVISVRHSMNTEQDFSLALAQVESFLPVETMLDIIGQMIG
jgi:HAD superfamily hydrolase (TIGR01509 family)